MRVLVLTSGGDAPGMNMVLFQLYKKFKKNLFACRAGFRGLIDNDIHPIGELDLAKQAKKAGSAIKTSRCLEFKSNEGFQKALANAKNFDVVIVLGGNGSYRGCCELAEKGVRTVFIPATIDNDVIISDYSLGYHTAVNACVTTIKNVMPSMESLGRSCIFEVMGRYCSRIAKCVNHKYPSDCLITNKKDIDYKKMVASLQKKHSQGKSGVIVLKENIIKTKTIIKNINKLDPSLEVKAVTVGYLQRGSKPTLIELEYAKSFAKLAIKFIQKFKFSFAVSYKESRFKIVYRNEDGEMKRLALKK